MLILRSSDGSFIGAPYMLAIQQIMLLIKSSYIFNSVYILMKC